MSPFPGCTLRYFLTLLILSTCATAALGDGGRRDGISSTRSKRGHDREPLRVLVVGDSLSHMNDGDYTWRYRLWQWFQQNEVDMQYVGPYTGTGVKVMPPSGEPPDFRKDAVWDAGANFEGTYAQDVDRAFLLNSNHFAATGRPVRDAKDWIRDVVKQYPTDLMLILLGVNDLAFCCSAEDTITYMSYLIVRARRANPDIRIAVSNVPYQSFLKLAWKNTLKYNQLLPNAIAVWSTQRSPIDLVDVAKYYACGTCDCPASFDGLHPNSWGDYHIAHAFSETLVDKFGIGSCYLRSPPQDDPSLIRSLPVPSNFKVEQNVDGGVIATWDFVPGAYVYKVEVTVGNDAPEVFDYTSNEYKTWPFYHAGMTYAVRVAAHAQNQTGEWTTRESAMARPNEQAAPTDLNGQDSEPGTGEAQPDGDSSGKEVHTDGKQLSQEAGAASRNAKRGDDANEPIPCIGGTAPTPKPCKPRPSTGPVTISTLHQYSTSSSFTNIALFSFLLATIFFGVRLCMSRAYRRI